MNNKKSPDAGKSVRILLGDYSVDLLIADNDELMLDVGKYHPNCIGSPETVEIRVSPSLAVSHLWDTGLDLIEAEQRALLPSHADAVGWLLRGRDRATISLERLRELVPEERGPALTLLRGLQGFWQQEGGWRNGKGETPKSIPHQVAVRILIPILDDAMRIEREENNPDRQKELA